jgi:hypothetical protein
VAKVESPIRPRGCSLQKSPPARDHDARASCECAAPACGAHRSRVPDAGGAALDHADRTQAGRRFQHEDDLAVPDALKRSGPPAGARCRGRARLVKNSATSASIAWLNRAYSHALHLGQLAAEGPWLDQNDVETLSGHGRYLSGVTVWSCMRARAVSDFDDKFGTRSARRSGDS